MNELLVFLDVDTQVDFMLPGGALYVSGAEEIIPNLERLMNWARQHHFPVLSSADAHAHGDPEFRIWPAHCVQGTPGQKRIPETALENATIVPAVPGSFNPPSNWTGQAILEKQTYNVADNPNFDVILDSLGPRRYVVFGVATEYCVRATVLAMRQRGVPVDVVVDAVQAITREGGEKAMAEMAAAGARLVLTKEVCAEKKVAKVCTSSSGLS
jgi:nicotinamidase/pyrazinamidase